MLDDFERDLSVTSLNNTVLSRRRNYRIFCCCFSGDVQGDRRDDQDGGQERGWQDFLQRVQVSLGSTPL